MAGTKFNLYRGLRRFTGPVWAYRLANSAMGFLDAAKPLAAVSCGAVVIHAAFLSLGGI